MNIKLFTLKRAYVLTVVCCISMASTTWGGCQGARHTMETGGVCNYNCDCTGYNATNRPGKNINCLNRICTKVMWLEGEPKSLVTRTIVSNPNPTTSSTITGIWCSMNVNNNENQTISRKNC